VFLLKEVLRKRVFVKSCRSSVKFARRQNLLSFGGEKLQIFAAQYPNPYS
jgi:hypothetical protein